MSSTTDKIKGAGNDAMGKVKESAGRALDDDKMRAEGLAQQAKGKAQKAVGEAKDAVKDAVDKA
ncbi:MAG TPA: CsbD family protein [Roseiarcus sp.]|nr:CsbD family protein [Roseiarcus sp.]